MLHTKLEREIDRGREKERGGHPTFSEKQNGLYQQICKKMMVSV